jgi:hypothetical protein
VAASVSPDHRFTETHQEEESFTEKEMRINLSESFGRALVITLPGDEERVKGFEARASASGVTGVTRFGGVEGLVLRPPQWWASVSSAGEWGRYQSHLGAIAQAIMENEITGEAKPLLIMEDDAVFADDFAERFELAMSELPEAWDFFYLGGSHSLLRQRPQKIEGSSEVIRTWGVNHHHAYAVRAESLVRLYRHLNRYGDLLADKNRLSFSRQVASLHCQAGVNIYSSRLPLIGQASGNSLTEGRFHEERWWPLQEQYLREA